MKTLSAEEQQKLIDTNPVYSVRAVHIDEVEANEYNPNSVAKTEMKLLHTSIDHDGYTQPIVTIYDEIKKKYIVVDGFHRYLTLKSFPDIYERNFGFVPVVVLKKEINDRMASTIRHNRARGAHAVTGMANIVFAMLDNGWQDEQICKELGMSAEELVRLKHVTGFSKLFEDVEYKKSWETKQMIQLRIKEQNHDKESAGSKA